MNSWVLEDVSDIDVEIRAVGERSVTNTDTDRADDGVVEIGTLEAQNKSVRIKQT